MGQFVKATMLGGVVFIAPLVIIAAVVREAVRHASNALEPVAEFVPEQRVAGVLWIDVVAVMAIVAVCFLTGLLIATRPGRAISDRLERVVLRQVPGFTFVRTMVHGVAGLDSDTKLVPALVRYDDNWMLGFVVERHGDALVTVFLPSAPTPAMGTLCFMTPDRVVPIDMPVMPAVSCVMRLGVGSRELLKKLEQARLGPFAALPPTLPKQTIS
ncbi:MAG: DUF502 domain-containing protein [Pirellulales bacterium]